MWLRMLSKEFFDEIKKELLPLKKYGKAVILYGSVLTPHFILRKSDVDVAVVTMKKENNLKLMPELLGRVNPNKYDVRIFELLPMYIKAEIIENFKVVYGDEKEVGEYFYFWRKLCKDFKRRKEIVTPEDLRIGRERLKLL
ncbi:MAG: DNA polymerase subunit beta [Candidatus Hydrothermarchaeota archaeon]|nr:MAG: DNA polymerase subunit beta [Candidatus Hydrothermarchaeota archaeon]